MARKSAASKSISVNLEAFDLQDIIGQAEAAMKPRERNSWGFFVDSITPEEKIATQFLDGLEQKDIPFAAIELTSKKLIAPVVGETREARQAKLDSMRDSLWATIRRGAAYRGMKVTAKDDGERAGDWLHLYTPAKRKAEIETE